MRCELDYYDLVEHALLTYHQSLSGWYRWRASNPASSLEKAWSPALKALRELGKKAPRRMPEWQLYGTKEADVVRAEYKERGGAPGRLDLTLWTKVCMNLYEILSPEEQGALKEESDVTYKTDMEAWNSGLENAPKGDPEAYEE